MERMAHPSDVLSNDKLFDELIRWNAYLEAEQTVKNLLRPPCP